jgi:hypothetical protein
MKIGVTDEDDTVQAFKENKRCPKEHKPNIVVGSIGVISRLEQKGVIMLKRVFHN